MLIIQINVYSKFHLDALRKMSNPYSLWTCQSIKPQCTFSNESVICWWNDHTMLVNSIVTVYARCNRIVMVEDLMVWYKISFG